MKTIEQIKDCQAIGLGYNSFRDLVLNPKEDMDMIHLNWCVHRAMEEYKDQAVKQAVDLALQMASERAETKYVTINKWGESDQEVDKSSILSCKEEILKQLGIE